MDDKPGDIKAVVTGENKWAYMGLNGTVDVALIIDRPCRVSVSITGDGGVEVRVYEGTAPQDGEQPVGTLGVEAKPDQNWISHQDGTLTVLPRKQEGD